MNKEERLKLENELLLTKSKARMINMYLDALSIIKEVREYIEEHMMEVAKIKGINGEENGAIYVAVADLLEILDKEKE